uniref:Uncharacterized protein n=1 Tax=Polytomella parva TaxID=51329 RepID=A0A7S0VAJ8_9CHLO
MYLQKISWLVAARTRSSSIAGAISVANDLLKEELPFLSRGKKTQVTQVTPSRKKGPIVEQFYTVPPLCPRPTHNPVTLKIIPKYSDSELCELVSKTTTPKQLYDIVLGHRFNQTIAVKKLARLSEIYQGSRYSNSDAEFCTNIFKTSVRQLDQFLHLCTNSELAEYVKVQGQLPFSQQMNLVERSLFILMQDNGKAFSQDPQVAVNTALGLEALSMRNPEVWKVLVPALNKNVKTNIMPELSEKSLKWFNEAKQ